MNIYVMPSGEKRRFGEKVPEGAVLYKPKKTEPKPEPKVEPEVKAVEEIQNKAIEVPKNKKKGGSKK